MNRLLRIAGENDIPIVDMRLKGKEEALSESCGGRCIIAIDRRKVKSRRDYKVKAAHELGHCITGSFYDASCPVVPRGRCERRAEKWAVRNTVSPSELKASLKGGMTEVWELAEHFGVTEEFMIKALKYYGMWNGD